MLATNFGTDPSRSLSILCLGAHCDDIEIGCGGSLLRLLAERPGSSVHFEVFSADDEREAEARASATAFLADAEHATVSVSRFTENHFPSELAALKTHVAGVRERLDPDVVFTHRRNDRHQDHRTIAELTWNSFRDHLVLEYEIPKYEGDLGHPNLFVPLSALCAERKIELLCEHFGTQRSKPWFRPETFRGLMYVRGSECNAAEGPAEAFHAVKLVV